MEPIIVAISASLIVLGAISFFTKPAPEKSADRMVKQETTIQLDISGDPKNVKRH